MSLPPAVLDLAAAARVLHSHTDDGARRVGQALGAWLDHGDGHSLEAAFGLASSGPGWRLAMRLDLRDDLIRRAAEKFYPDQPAAMQAAEMAQAWARYTASGWKRERAHAAVPACRQGKVEAAFWRILRCRDWTLSERAIRAILTAKTSKVAENCQR